MQPNIENIILSATGAETIDNSTVIQSLWSGYGQIVRLKLVGGAYSSVILKHIKLPKPGNHPRGWNTDLSHQRKIRSYQVEAYWYEHYAQYCTDDCTVPVCLAVHQQNNETLLVLTDLNSAGFEVRKSSVEIRDIYACLAWLASFHAIYMNSKAEGLWECGSYWHLDTRPDELAALNDKALRLAAPLIDKKLRECRYQTFIHGDAKLANFCFYRSDFNSNFSQQVAAVDFQYIGRGCGMKDVAYFISSCLDEKGCETMESQLLNYYFSALRHQVILKKTDVNMDELEHEWRELYSFAWADFYRFIKGWSPGHWKINSYSEKLTKNTIKKLSIIN